MEESVKMKRAFLFLMVVLCVLCCATFAYALDEKYFGEWLYYGTTTEFSPGNIIPKTIATAYQHNTLEDAIILNEDDTVEFRFSGMSPAFGTWAETEELKGTKLGDSPSILITDEDGVEVLFFFTDGMLNYATYSSVDITLYYYYKPGTYRLNDESYQGTAWKTSWVYSDTPDDRIEHPKELPASMYPDCLFMLNEDKTADVLINYIPLHGTWIIDGLNIIIHLDNGGVLNFQRQLDGSLFGTFKTSANSPKYHVQFGTTDPFVIEQPTKDIQSFVGTWDLSALHDKMYFTYPKEKLTFTMTLKISANKAVV